MEEKEEVNVTVPAEYLCHVCLYQYSTGTNFYNSAKVKRQEASSHALAEEDVLPVRVPSLTGCNLYHAKRQLMRQDI